METLNATHAQQQIVTFNRFTCWLEILTVVT